MNYKLVALIAFIIFMVLLCYINYRSIKLNEIKRYWKLSIAYLIAGVIIFVAARMDVYGSGDFKSVAFAVLMLGVGNLIPTIIKTFKK